MYRVSPASPYRLRTLAQTDAHLYQVSGYMFGLQMLGLVVATGPADPDLKKVE